MTDKEIIIDGVDVAGCMHYDKPYCDQSYCGKNGLLKNTPHPKKCEGRKNCYYKQLKRKEQECEELKEKYNEYVKFHHYNNAEFEQERNSLIQEIQYKNRYKQALETIKNICDEMDGIYPLSQDILTIINEVTNNNDR